MQPKLEQSAENKSNSKKPRNDWTRIFVLVMEYLLRDYRDKIEIIPEYELYRKSMSIDVVIIKLLEDFVIKNTVMKFFKRHNVIEFKGPTDYLNIEAFDRVLSYFYAYISQNSLELSEVAITFVSVKKPIKLLETLQNKRKYKIIPTKARGIYYIKGASCVPAMQLVINSELSAHDAAWIKAIRNNWTVQDGVEMIRIFEEGNDLLNDIMLMLTTANSGTFEEAKKMTIYTKANVRRMNRILDSWIIESGKGEQLMHQGMRQGMRQTARNMKAKGLDLHLIAEMTGLTFDEVLNV